MVGWWRAMSLANKTSQCTYTRVKVVPQRRNPWIDPGAGIADRASGRRASRAHPASGSMAASAARSTKCRVQSTTVRLVPRSVTTSRDQDRAPCLREAVWEPAAPIRHEGGSNLMTAPDKRREQVPGEVLTPATKDAKFRMQDEDSHGPFPIARWNAAVTDASL